MHKVGWRKHWRVKIISEQHRRLPLADGRPEQAAAVLSNVLDVSDDMAQQKVDDITHTLTIQRRPRLSDLRGNVWGLRRVVWVGIGISIFQQLNGINVIFYYSTSLWQSVGFSESDSLISSVISAATFVVVTIIAVALVDRIGRSHCCSRVPLAWR